MSKRHDNTWPAFPSGLQEGFQSPLHEGLTIRQYAAIKAMQGLLADGMDDSEYVAMRAVKAADALLAELEK